MQQKTEGSDQLVIKGKRKSDTLFTVAFILISLIIGAFASDIYFLYIGLSFLSAPIVIALAYYFTKNFSIELTSNKVIIKKSVFGIPFSRASGNYKCFEINNNCILFYNEEEKEHSPFTHTKPTAVLGLNAKKLIYNRSLFWKKSITPRKQSAKEIYVDVTNFLFYQVQKEKISFIETKFVTVAYDNKREVNQFL